MTDPFKLIILPETKAGMTRAELHHHLEFVHGPLVMKYPDVSGGFTEYVHHYIAGEPASPAELDAVTFVSFATMADMIASKANENYQRYVYADEDNFREEAGSRAFSGLAHVIRDGPRDAPVKLLIFRKLRNARGCTERLGKPCGRSAGRRRTWRWARRRQSPLAAGRAR